MLSPNDGSPVRRDGQRRIQRSLFLTQKLLPSMNDGGRIVNISSGLARIAMGGSSAYGAVKGAVEVFTRYLAKELGPRTLDDVANAAEYLVSDLAGFISGQHLLLSGGGPA